MRSTDTYLNFAGNTREAFEFYRSVFGGQFDGVLTYAELAGESWNPPESDRDLIGHISLKLSPTSYLMGSDVGSAQRDARASSCPATTSTPTASSRRAS